MKPARHLDGGVLPLLIAVLVVLCVMAPAGGGLAATADGENKPVEMTAFFPEIEGWTAEPAPSVYDSETLYEYIDGAADLYINYNFQELAVLNYEKGDDQGFTIDIYRHDTPRNAFGIYSQERPSEGAYLDIGTQGYYDTGILNFVLGDYYVKLSGFYLGDDDESLLKSVANDVSGRLGGTPGFPRAVHAFPDSGKVGNSEKYIAVSFMGHGFLHSAYVVEYKSGGKDLKLFIMEATGADEAQKMVDGYLALAEKKGEEVFSDGGLHRFKDPYQGSKGAVNMRSRGNYVWGLMSDDASICGYYLKGMEEGLERTGLLAGAAKE